MFNKKGISAVVVTILIVVIGIGAVGLLYQFLIEPIMEDQADRGRRETECMEISLEILSVNETSEDLRLRRGRGGPDGNITVSVANLQTEDMEDKQMERMNSDWFDVSASVGHEIRYWGEIEGYECNENSRTISTADLVE